MINLLERTQTQAVTVEAPQTGTVTRWYVPEGSPIGRGGQLGIFVNGKGMEAIKAPIGGQVTRLLVKPGTHVGTGAPIAEIVPDVPQAPLPRKPSPVSPKAQNGSQSLTERAQQPDNERRGLHIEELTVKPKLPAPVPRQRAKRPKIVCRTTRPTDKQSQRFDDLATELQSLGYDFARSELERCMYQLFLSLDVAEVAKLANENRQEEQAGRYGIGYV